MLCCRVNNNGGIWPNSTDARLHTFEKTGSLPDNTTDVVPNTSGTVYTAMITSFGSYLELSVDSLALFLAPGDYWIGLTPILEFATYGQEFHQATAAGLIGDPTAMRNRGAGLGLALTGLRIRSLMVRAVIMPCVLQAGRFRSQACWYSS
jgi:hypothetical protein